MTGGRAEDNIQLLLGHPGDRRSGVHLLRSSLLVLMNSEECESVFSKYCVREGLLQLRNTTKHGFHLHTDAQTGLESNTRE